MKKNLGKKDRIIRGSIAAALALGAIFFKSWLLALLALFVALEALISWCPFYQLLGKNTCPKR